MKRRHKFLYVLAVALGVILVYALIAVIVKVVVIAVILGLTIIAGYWIARKDNTQKP